MFTSVMATEPIPERIYALYKLVCVKKKITKSDLQNYMEPKEIYGGSSSYFHYIYNTAEELKLIALEDNYIIPLVPKESVKSMDDFRTYVISKLGHYKEGQFFKCTNFLVNMNEEIFKYESITDNEMQNKLIKVTGENLSAPMLRGWRFWAQFLGIGYINTMAFLPNSYIYLKSVLRLLNLEKNREYSMDEFMSMVNQYAEILSNNMHPERSLNIALSNGLRQLHDNKEIELKYVSDKGNLWRLYPSNETFNEPIGAIVYKGVNK